MSVELLEAPSSQECQWLALLLLKRATNDAVSANNGHSGCKRLFEHFLCEKQLYCGLKCTDECLWSCWSPLVAKNVIVALLLLKRANNDALSANNGHSGCKRLFEHFLCEKQLYCGLKCTDECLWSCGKSPLVARNVNVGFVAAKKGKQ